MKVISVNVCEPEEIRWRDQLVKTSIFKKPVSGRVFAGNLSLDGDKQADLIAHGGAHRAVMVYQKESYLYWSQMLGFKELRYGQFGENLTVEGMADTDVCIGDRFEIGSAIFEVTQPRVTCYKVGISLGVEQMPTLLVKHNRPGFYFRVIKEGYVQAGDQIVKVLDGLEKMSIAVINRLLYSEHHPEFELRQALKIPALSQGWQVSFQQLLNASVSISANGNAGLSEPIIGPPAWTGFKSFVVKSSRVESKFVRSYELEPIDKSLKIDFLSGQHVAIRVGVHLNSTHLTRVYSLCGPPRTGTLRIAVKQEVDGIASNYLHENVGINDILELSAPRGTFILPNLEKPLVLLSGGIGITPLISMLYEIAGKRPRHQVYWIHSCQNKEYHTFSEEVQSLRDRLPSLRCITIYSKPKEDEQKGIDYHYSGHLNLDILNRIDVDPDSEFYVCGPSGYLVDILSALKSMGISESRMNTERFGINDASVVGGNAVPHVPSDNTGIGPLVTFSKSKISFRWNEDFGNLLNAAEACNIQIKWSCRSGVCHRCESSIIDGEFTYLTTPISGAMNGYVLMCCAMPKTDIVLDL